MLYVHCLLQDQHHPPVCVFPRSPESLCSVETLVDAAQNGEFQGTLYQKGSLRNATEDVPEPVLRGCSTCTDSLNQSVAVLRLAASPSDRSVTVKVTEVACVRTGFFSSRTDVLQVLRLESNNGKPTRLVCLSCLCLSCHPSWMPSHITAADAHMTAACALSHCVQVPALCKNLILNLTQFYNLAVSA